MAPVRFPRVSALREGAVLAVAAGVRHARYRGAIGGTLETISTRSVRSPGMARQAAVSASWSSIAVWKGGPGARREGTRGGNTVVMIGATGAARGRRCGGRPAGHMYSEGPAARASGAQVQDVNPAIGLASVTISTRSRSSFSKTRQRATSASLSNGPCARPVSSSITVQVGSQTGIPRK